MAEKDDWAASGREDFINWLEQKHALVRASEEQALAMLKNGDADGYRAKMRQKADTLLSLEAEGMAYLPRLKGKQRLDSQYALEAFSAGARTAIELDSAFYMSALLYPQDHKNGEPDNLALFIDSLKKA